MVVLATGHQVRCLLWVQGVILQQRNWLLMCIKILCTEYILGRIFTTKSMLDVAILLKRLTWSTVKDVPINNNNELSNIRACSFHVLDMLEEGQSTQSLVVSCKYWVVLLISTRFSSYSQVILFRELWIKLSHVSNENHDIQPKSITNTCAYFGHLM